MSLPSFTITGTLLDLLGNTALGEIVGNGLGGATPATVTFTSNIPAGYFVTFGGVGYRVDEVTAVVNSDGSITRNGDPVMLLANDGGLSVDGVQWQVHVTGMKRFWFNAPTDGGTVDLDSVVPVPGLSVSGVLSVTAEQISNSSAIGRSILKAADQAAVQAIVGATGGGTPTDGSVTFPKLAAGAVVTASETIAANNNDTTIPTSAAVQAAITAAVTALLNGAPGALDTLKELADAINDDASFATTITTALAAKTANLIPTAVKTSAYTAAVSDFIPVDATSGTVAVTLPTAPVDKTRIAVKKIDASANTVTIPAGGSDVFNKSGGSTSLTLSLQNQAAVLQYKASGAIWYVVSTDVPLGGLDARYQAIDADLTALAAIPAGDGYAKRVGSTWVPMPMLPKSDLSLPISVTEDGVALCTASTTSTVGTSETIMTVSVAATGLQVEYIHWKNDETDPATTITFNASIKVAGVIYRLTFGGRTTAVLDPGGRIISDEVGISVAVGDAVGVRTFLASGTAYVPRFFNTIAAKGGFTAAADLTAPGSTTIAASTSGPYGPATLLGHADPSAKSVFLLGDSILRGTGDGEAGPSASTTPNAPQWGMAGFGVRALAGKAGIVQGARNSDQAAVAVTAASLRRLGMVNRCTSAIIQLGINDMSNPVATLQANLMTLAKLMRKQGIPKVFLTTITPFTTSTDGWATTTNQTPTGSNTNRVTHNGWVRAGCPVNSTTLVPVTVGTGGALLAGSPGHPVTGYFEVADTVESARDSGKWKAARRTVSTGAMTAGVYEVNAAGAAFVAGLISAGGDVGTTISVMGAGTAGGLFKNFVDTRNSATQVSCIEPAETTVSGAIVAIGPTTGDGIHPSSDGHLLMQAAIDVTQL